MAGQRATALSRIREREKRESMTCNECKHLIIRKCANGSDITVSLFCDIDHFCVSSLRFPIIECNRVDKPVNVCLESNSKNSESVLPPLKEVIKKKIK